MKLFRKVRSSLLVKNKKGKYLCVPLTELCFKYILMFLNTLLSVFNSLDKNPRFWIKYWRWLQA